MIDLVSVYDFMNAPEFLYDLLYARPKIANISHKEMPSEAQHMSFYLSKPYLAWYIIRLHTDTKIWVGAIYLTNAVSIGVQVKERFQRRGIARGAIQMLMEKHPHDYYLANVAPGNVASETLFLNLGFNVIQRTYCYATPVDGR